MSMGIKFHRKRKDIPNKYKIKGDHVEVFFRKGGSFILDIDDWEKLKKYSWFKQNSRGREYVRTNEFGNAPRKSFAVHAKIMNPKKGFVVDHIDGDTFNNRKSNLRICKQSDNMKNRKLNANNLSGFKGVTTLKYANSTKYKADLQHNGKRYGAPQRACPKEAAGDYDKLAIKYHGEFALTNKKLGLL